MNNLFQIGDFRLHSGRKSTFKIECDALTDEDWETLARLISQRYTFGWVHGIPKGGWKLAECLWQYAGDPIFQLWDNKGKEDW